MGRYGDHPHLSTIRIVVLANSNKPGGRCLAGIELSTGKWIRPVTNTANGAVPLARMQLDNQRYPELLDIIDLPLDATGPDFDFERENQTILQGGWNFIRKANVAEVLGYVETLEYILHNSERYCTLEDMQQLPVDQRQTLQLIQVQDFRAIDDPFGSRKHKWKSVINSGGTQIMVGITDPIFIQKLTGGHQPSQNCLLTMSMSMPFNPDDRYDSPPCWKLIAGVIEL